MVSKKPFGSIWDRFWEGLGRVWGGFGEGFGRIWELLGRFWKDFEKILGAFGEIGAAGTNSIIGTPALIREASQYAGAPPTWLNQGLFRIGHSLP